MWVGERRPWRVIVADDHPIVRVAITEMVERDPELSLAGAASDGLAALRLIDERSADVAVIDLGMPELDGIEIALRCRAAGTCRILIFTALDDADAAHRCLSAGARGYLTKDSGLAMLSAGIHAVARDEIVVAEHLRLGVLGRVGETSAGEHRDGRARLSPRETLVLSCAAEGMTATQIGRSLHISEGTVKTYLARVYDKLGVRGRSAAVAEAIRHGMLD